MQKWWIVLLDKYNVLMHFKQNVEIQFDNVFQYNNNL